MKGNKNTSIWTGNFKRKEASQDDRVIGHTAYIIIRMLLDKASVQAILMESKRKIEEQIQAQA